MPTLRKTSGDFIHDVIREWRASIFFLVDIGRHHSGRIYSDCFGEDAWIMEPVKTEDCDVVYKGPTEQIGDLWCHRVRPHLIKATYEPSDEERELLAQGGRIQLFVFKEPIPPVDINVIAKEESEPVGEHGWKIDVEPGDTKEKGNDESERESEDESDFGSIAETPGTAQSTSNGSASTAISDGTRGNGEDEEEGGSE